MHRLFPLKTNKGEQIMAYVARLMGIMFLGIVVMVAFPAREQDAAQEACTGPYEGKRLSQEQLNEVLAAHDTWLKTHKLKTHKKDGRRANLCGAKLMKLHLVGANLGDANLVKANLFGATLTGANFEKAKLTKAILNTAQLAEADLSGAVLQGAKLYRTILTQANLTQADLTDADLREADLTEATLINATLHAAKLIKAKLHTAKLQEANLTKANLTGADLTQANLHNAKLGQITLAETDLTDAKLQGARLAGATFEPKAGSLPKGANLFFGGEDNAGRFDKLRGLNQLRYNVSSHGLRELREAYKTMGMRLEERAVTYALKLEERKRANAVEKFFTYIFLELTCGYGLYPWRPLKILIGLTLIFAVPYIIALQWSTHGRAWIWVVWHADRVRQDEGEEKPIPVTLDFFLPRLQSRAAGRWWEPILRHMIVPIVSLYFSLLSAFHVGWNELDIGAWIRRIQPREYTLRASGWVRTVAGIQALISVYLLALWAMTYFGRPFE